MLQVSKREWKESEERDLRQTVRKVGGERERGREGRIMLDSR